MIEVIVLAGGEGKRLRPVVRDVPKPMADVAGRPFLWWLMDRLHQQQARRVVLSVGYKADAIQDYFGEQFQGMGIAYSVESEPLGTGGAIRLALEQATQAQVIVMNGDTYTDLDLRNFITKFQSTGSDLAIAATHLDNVGRYGAISIDETSDRLIRFEEKQRSSAGYINAGVYCLRPDIFRKYGVPAKFSFERDFLSERLAELNPVVFKETRAFIDIGVPEDYALAQTVIPALAATEASNNKGVRN
jgi:D-glycero-alpha-D-manno-heptose 1-phosphate guanylyltransferase